jgi:hypothetical protein
MIHTDPSQLFDRFRQLPKTDTGLWMLESKEWNDWVAMKRRFIWIHGIPGSGKTVVATTLAQHMLSYSSKKAGVVYYYCYFGHNQDETLPFLRWVLVQLCRQARFVPQSMQKLSEISQHPSLRELLAGLEEIVEFFEVTYIIVDAVDESQEPRTRLLDMLNMLVKDPRFQKIQLLTTSREYFDIEAAFQSSSVAVSMKNDAVDKDIRTFVHSELQTNYRFSKWPINLRDDIECAIVTKANGM